LVRAESTSSSKPLTVIAFVLAIAALYFGRKVFIPLALAVVFSFLLTPFVSLFERIRFRRVPAAITVLLLALALMGLATWGVAGQLVDTMVRLPDYKDNLDAKIQSLHASRAGGLSKASATIQELNKELSSSQAAEPGRSRPMRPVPVQVTAPASNVVQDLGALLGPLSEPLETAVIAVIFTIFMLVKREDLRNRAISLAGRGQLSLMTQALDDAGRRLSRYLGMQFLVNAGYGCIFGAALYFIGVPHPLLWGMVAGILRFVPYIGTFIGAAIPVALSIAVFPGWRQAGLTFGTFLILELTVSNSVEPLLYGAHTGISSLAILVAAVFWATLWGPVGLILSTPLTVCLVVLGRHVPELSFLEVVLGDEPVLPPEQRFYQRLLALDPEEARKIAETYLNEHSVESFYQTILIPALKLAEQDYHTNALDEEAHRFVLRSSAELIEEMDDQLAQEPDRQNLSGNGAYQRRPGQVEGLRDRIACVPACPGADELVVTMILQLLQHSGHHACRVKAADPEEMLAELSRHESSVVCVSCIALFELGSARSLCRNLKARMPHLETVAGLWNAEGGSEAARERFGPSSPHFVTADLSEALQEICRLSEAAPPADTAPGVKRA